jgi:hypothetical protein
MTHRLFLFAFVTNRSPIKQERINICFSLFIFQSCLSFSHAYFYFSILHLQLFIYLPALIFGKYNFPRNRKNIVFYSFYKPFCGTCLLYSTRRCAPRALKRACDKMMSYKTRIINYYFIPKISRFTLLDTP